jgi:hypothetical protein
VFKIFSLFGEVLLKDEEAQKGLDGIDKKGEGVVKRLGGMATTVAKWGAGIVTAGAVAGGAMLAFANKTAAAADEIDKMSIRSGHSRTRLQELKFVSGQLGVEFGVIESSTAKLQMAMNQANQGSEKMTEAFGKLGVSADDLASKTKAEIWDGSIKALADMEDVAERDALAFEIFGKSAGDLNNLFEAGSEGMADLSERAHELGSVMTDEAIAANVKFADTMDEVKTMIGAAGMQLGTAMLPILQTFLEWVLKYMPQIQETAKVVFEAIQTGVSYVVDWIAQLIGWLDNFKGSSDGALSAVKDIFMFYFDFYSGIIQTFIEWAQEFWAQHGEGILETVTYYFNLIKDTISEVIDAVVGFVQEQLAILFEFWDENGAQIMEAVKTYLNFVLDIWTTVFNAIWEVIEFIMPTIVSVIEVAWDIIKGVFSASLDIIMGLIKIFTGIFTGDWKKVWEGVKDVFQGVWNGIVTGLKASLNLIITAVNAMIRGLNRIKVDIPDWVPGFGGKTFGISIAEIPKLAKGGNILDDGAVMVGEEGPEILSGIQGARVTPLDHASVGGIDYEKMAKAIAEHVKPDVTVNNQFHSPEPITAVEARKENEKMLRRLAVEWGMN